MGKWLIRVILVAIVAAAVWGGWQVFRGQDEVQLRTVTLDRGPLALTVTATGSLAPVTEVQVGCEESGTVAEILVSHNNRVSRGQVIARLKPELRHAENEQAKAELARVEAHLKQLQVQQGEAERRLNRVELLRADSSAHDDEHEAAQALQRATEADTTAGEAAVEGAKSRVTLTEYRLDQTTIRSPIDGFVLDCRVKVGQTVAAALMTPELFILAEDLARMQLLADISEADVGHICPGQRATFTVNAFRDRVFEGRVREIRNQPRTVGNVVTYTVVIDVANEDHLLRPGMPADISVEIVRREEVLTVDNAALRFRPPLPPDQIREVLDGLEWPTAPEPIPVQIISSFRPASRPGGVEIVPPPLEPEMTALWQYVEGSWRAVPVWVWNSFTDNRKSAILASPELEGQEPFVVEFHGPDESGASRLEQAILLSRPEQRRL